ncbi:uncharacterized protein SPPG_00988 [Spizellomyces punctatus DAOM BR117]|uniref:Uncharacterized protein n=1 Tax=Spizellomyces punctatus (strain DAOM BR117) TaxID=645134 RepID=A0A0L0HRD6_SPIPD|nr:uncharacterized protein SPPG_00988 [Spizellomyces punctatus DAOM BR117]KND03505.1 hypothetical protein SPPG_00988 [Spizellomyces punctatus DAOM BR117]|eukprot:XP_016611544.1 hypothetical protein SPPG_00988 [Spizellomyces punctatus DAOM BR117]
MYVNKRRTFEKVPNNAESEAYFVEVVGINPNVGGKFTSPRRGWTTCEAFDPDTGVKCSVEARRPSTERFALCARHIVEERSHHLLLVREWLSTYPFPEGSDENEKRILTGNIYKKITKMDASDRWHTGLRNDLVDAWLEMHPLSELLDLISAYDNE